MKRIIIAVVSCVSLASLTLAAAPRPALPAAETSPDLIKRSSAPAAARPLAVMAAEAAVTDEEVGDADSFGRNVRYLGLAQTDSLNFQPDCAPFPPDEFSRCITLAPSPASTPFDESDLALIELPAKATKSLLCFTVTPLYDFEFFNDTGVPQNNAQFNVRPIITIENEVLDDPALIDPMTGLPFGGQLTVPLSTYLESRSLAVDERAFKRMFLTRSCIAGVISKRSLIGNYALTEAQANQFFKKPITVRLGAQGNLSLVSFANYTYGFRLYGD